MEIRRVAVVGAGVMGRGIATTFARSGFEAALVSRNPAAVKDVPESVRVTGELPPTANPRHRIHTRVARSEAGLVPPNRCALWGLAALRRENADKLRRILEIANE